ncbi:MAG: beta-N-acetylhexosaminidase [Proteobacteria bacterium]|nr:beta-N-acetylhexosaminidase [Pseudomonadota bacterium]
MSIGPIMLDLRGYILEDDEREMLRHPLVGGVILFSRNYQDIAQVGELCRQIHALRQPPLLIAVDHEGGRVQRFRQGFSALPPCHCFGKLYDEDKLRGLQLAEQAGWLMAAELLAIGVDFSFAPVLDLNKGISDVIGDRSFHREPEIATELARRFIRGMKAAGMPAVGKHFPGHGSVKEDSHHAIPVDRRRYEDIAMSDLVPFERLINAGLPAVMPAHVIYPKIDDKPAGYSAVWLQDILRQQLAFQGAIFSDDISMAGAEVVGSYHDRAVAALHAGCDMVLICNNQHAAVKLLADLDLTPQPVSQVRLMRMHGQASDRSFTDLRKDGQWQSVSKAITVLERSPELKLGDDEINS